MTKREPRRRERGLFRIALGVAAAVHAILLWVVVIPDSRTALEPTPLVVIPQAAEAPPRALPRPAPESAGKTLPPEPERADRSPAVQAPRDAPLGTPPPRWVARRSAPLDRTIPPTTLGAFEAAVQPLIVTPTGIGRRPPDPRRMAIMRAESLLDARLASLPGTRRRDPGAIGLANGGVTVAVPWGGFLPADRKDGTWREERCRGKDSGEADKAGEGEARRAQCG